MTLYAYEVVNKTGATVTGRVEAERETMAAEKLRGMGYMVVDLREVRPSPFQELFKVKRKVNTGELSLFSRQLATMLDAGIPLTRALFTLSRQAANPTMANALKEIAGNVEGGISFTEGLKAHPSIFSDLYVGMIRSGEVGGNLEKTLVRLSDQLQKDKELRDNIKSATFYPIIVGLFAVLVLFGMMFFLVPVFMGFFPPGVVLPLPTRVIIAISEALRSYWYLLFLGVIVLVLGLRYYLNTPAGRRRWDSLKFKIPVFGSLIHRSVIARFSRTLSTLLSGGIPVMQAIEAAGDTSGNTLIMDTVKDAGEKIQEGMSISVPLEQSGIFPAMVTHMVAVGEETGALPDLLNRVAGFFEEEVATITKGLTALIEPIMLIFVGVIVGAMLVALYLPIFTVITQVGM